VPLHAVTLAALPPGVSELAGLLMAAAGLSLLLFYLRSQSTAGSTTSRRMRTFVSDRTVAADPDAQRPFGERVMRPILTTLAGPLLRLTPGTVLASTREQLIHAGVTMGPVEFLGLRFVIAAIGLVAGSLAATSEDLPSWLRLLMPFITVALGYALPGVFLSRIVSGRQKTIRRALAPTLEMLSISIEAGLAFDGAIAHVSQRFKNPLSDELRRMFVEFQMGRTRRQALTDFAGRIGLLQVDRFVQTVIQGEAMGVPLSRALQDQAIELRNAQRQAAESAARTAPIKMMFPLVLMILPALFIIILGPTVATLLGGGAGF
jgi:tight adherence protein C